MEFPEDLAFQDLLFLMKPVAGGGGDLKERRRMKMEWGKKKGEGRAETEWRDRRTWALVQEGKSRKVIRCVGGKKIWGRGRGVAGKGGPGPRYRRGSRWPADSNRR